MREPDPGLRPHERIASIPLGRLELSPDNARKTPANDAALAELKASIAAHGLLENLVVRPQGGEGADARYAVIAGGRRLAAMQALAGDGALAADFPVPCRVCGDGALSRELSLAENTVRVAMHPADQVETFRRLADDGATTAGIAARFGIGVRTVEQRLRLGGAAPVLLAALRRRGDRPGDAGRLRRHRRPGPPDRSLGAGEGAGATARPPGRCGGC